MKFEEWLNENEKTPKKAATFKKDDVVFVKDKNYFVTRRWQSDPGKRKEYYPQGESILAKITEVAVTSGRWVYTLEIVAGIARVWETRVSGTRDYGVKSWNKTIQAVQTNLTSEGVTETLKILESAIYKIDDKVTFNEKTYFINGVDPDQSLKDKQPCYFLKSDIQGTTTQLLNRNSVPQDDLTSEEEFDEEQEKLIIGEIEKKIGVKLEKRSEYYEMGGEVYDLSKVSGYLCFKNEADLKKFADELKKFIESKLDKNLQKVADYRIAFPTSSSYHTGNLKNRRVQEVARALKIDYKELFAKKKGYLGAKKLGIL
jgi:hypothetical protein